MACFPYCIREKTKMRYFEGAIGDEDNQMPYIKCQHIAAAVINNCDCIISWNFKHIVNIKTIRGARAITNLEGYKGIDIINPSALLESEG